MRIVIEIPFCLSCGHEVCTCSTDPEPFPTEYPQGDEFCPQSHVFI